MTDTPTPEPLRRYYWSEGYDGMPGKPEPCDDGEFVLYTDALALQRENETLRAERDRLRYALEFAKGKLETKALTLSLPWHEAMLAMDAALTAPTPDATADGGEGEA